MKLHLGCGSRTIPGYLQVDVRKLPNVDIVSSIDKLSFAPDSSVDVIYCCHVLEHVSRMDVQKVFKEWRRLLKSGGLLRISVPDFEAIVAIYLKTGDMADIIGKLHGKQDYDYNFHYISFDFKFLSRNLAEVGFTNVRRYDCKLTEHGHIDDYSHAVFTHKDQEIPISLNIECEKL